MEFKKQKIDNKTIKYVAYYDLERNSNNNRVFFKAATNKISYIAFTMGRVDKYVEIISSSQTMNKKKCKKEIQKISDQIDLILPCSLGTGNLLKRLLDRLVVRLQVLYELTFKCTKNDVVFVYHSLGYLKTIAFAKKIRKFKLILEVEEIYGDVNGSQKIKKNELRYFCLANAYIFPTKLLNKKINLKNKPYAIIHGTYQVEEDRKCKFDDGKIHCVYAGTFDPRKGGAKAAAAAEYLDSNYHIHIIGFGSEEDKKNMQEQIKEILKTTECELTYDGLLSGEEYIKFIQGCHVGLSTQNPNAEFNETSFPSKVLSYMANGLRVVSIRIKALETSAVNDLLYYYEDDTPKAIAEAIKKINLDDNYYSRERIRELDIDFAENIKNLLEKV